MRLEAILAWLLCSKYRRALHIAAGAVSQRLRAGCWQIHRGGRIEKSNAGALGGPLCDLGTPRGSPCLVSQALNGLELGGAAIQVTAAAPNASLTAPVQVPEGEIDDDGQGGLNLSAASRASLMQKL